MLLFFSIKNCFWTESESSESGIKSIRCQLTQHDLEGHTTIKWRFRAELCSFLPRNELRSLPATPARVSLGFDAGGWHSEFCIFLRSLLQTADSLCLLKDGNKYFISDLKEKEPQRWEASAKTKSHPLMLLWLWPLHLHHLLFLHDFFFYTPGFPLLHPQAEGLCLLWCFLEGFP